MCRQRVDILEITVIKINVIHARAIKEIAPRGIVFHYMSQFIRVILIVDVYFLFNAREKEKKCSLVFEPSLKTESILAKRMVGRKTAFKLMHAVLLSSSPASRLNAIFHQDSIFVKR